MTDWNFVEKRKVALGWAYAFRRGGTNAAMAIDEELECVNKRVPVTEKLPE